MILSLKFRFLVVATGVLVAFSLLTGFVLDSAFRRSAEKGVYSRLQQNIRALLSAADVDRRGVLQLPRTAEKLPDPRYAMVGSELYAEVVSFDGRQHWRSPSMTGIDVNFSQTPKVNQTLFQRTKTAAGNELFVLSFGVLWDQNGKRYVFRAAEDMTAYHQKISGYRKSLWIYFSGGVVVLILVQAGFIHWGLRPLRQVADDLAEIESGHSDGLAGDYPKELRGLTGNLNALIATTQSQLERYRDALANLAHSLKTPLAVIRGEIDNQRDIDKLRQTTQEQLDRMVQIVDYQLQRAAVSGRKSLRPPVSVKQMVHKVVTALDKVYADKAVQYEIDIKETVLFYGDEGDLMEVCGNLLDNAFKWCRRRVRVTAESTRVLGLTQPVLCLRVEDDGPGVPAEAIDQVLQRGKRADATVPGHGIGLAMVKDAVLLYGGRLTVAESELGGALFLAQFG